MYTHINIYIYNLYVYTHTCLLHPFPYKRMEIAL